MPCEDTGLTVSLKPGELKMDYYGAIAGGALANIFLNFAGLERK